MNEVVAGRGGISRSYKITADVASGGLYSLVTRASHGFSHGGSVVEKCEQLNGSEEPCGCFSVN